MDPGIGTISAAFVVVIVGTFIGAQFAINNSLKPPLKDGQRGFNVFITGAITGAAVVALFAFV